VEFFNGFVEKGTCPQLVRLILYQARSVLEVLFIILERLWSFWAILLVHLWGSSVKFPW